MTTSNGYTLQYSKNFCCPNMIHFHIKETGSYIGVPEHEQVNLHITANGYLELRFYTDKDDITTLPKHKLVKLFTTTKDVHGKYRLYRDGLYQNDPNNPLLCTIVNESLFRANQNNGEINIDPLFVDRRQADTTERH